ncbi:MAG: hypothetical protein M3O46_08970, partial [Myxococcota bacterium]|nr:hypothetical protein [Myxococcota bacterium]
MKLQVARAVLPIAGAVFGAEIAGVFEAWRIQDQGRASLGDLANADVAVLVPIATIIGIVAAAGAWMWNPARPWEIGDLGRVGGFFRGLSSEARALVSAAALVTPSAVLVWALVCAHGARAA